jgi:4'-phosphopantetheinyl transferase
MLLENQQQLIWQNQLDYQINNHQIHIWLIDINNYLQPNFAAYLDDQEIERAQRFKFIKDRNCFIGSHAALRMLLGKYCSCDPCAITYEYTANNKPILTGNNLIKFNLSHSHSQAIIAVTKNHPVGIDIEYMQEKKILAELAKRFFSTQEYAEYKSLPAQQKTLGFYNCWTRKEAFVKALGIGITCPLKSFSVNLTPEIHAKILSMHKNKGDISQWQLYGFIPAKQYCAAIAWCGPEKELYGCKM